MEFLFADLGQIVHKAADDFAVLVSARITTHKAAEAERERKRKADEEARIAAEAKRLADEQVRQAEAQRLAAERLAEESARQAAALAAADAAKAQRAEPATTLQVAAEVIAARQVRDQQAALIERGRVIVDDIIAAEVLRDAVIANDPATLKLGVICERLGVTMTAQFLADVLHVRPARVDGASKLFTESQYLTICRQLQAHVGAMAELYAGTRFST